MIKTILRGRCSPLPFIFSTPTPIGVGSHPRWEGAGLRGPLCRNSISEKRQEKLRGLVFEEPTFILGSFQTESCFGRLESKLPTSKRWSLNRDVSSVEWRKHRKWFLFADAFLTRFGTLTMETRRVCSNAFITHFWYHFQGTSVEQDFRWKDKNKV